MKHKTLVRVIAAVGVVSLVAAALLPALGAYL
jgi:hypothetical protein